MRRYVYLLLYLTTAALIIPIVGLAGHGLVTGVADPGRVHAFAAERGTPVYLVWLVPVLVVVWGVAALIAGAALVRRRWRRN